MNACRVRTPFQSLHEVQTASALRSAYCKRHVVVVIPSLTRDGAKMKNKLYACIAVACLTWAMPTLARAWGSDGHKTVGMIADILLAGPVENDVKKILGGKTLSTVAIWADCAKGFSYCRRQPSVAEKAYANRNPHHHDYHYTDVPIQETSYRPQSAGTKPYDAVGVMRYAVQVLQGKAQPSADFNLNKREALWLLAHVVGDIHQPLHAGALYFDHACAHKVDPNQEGAGLPNFGIGTEFAESTGGNDFKISASRNLHSYWDDDIVHANMRLKGIPKTEIRQFAQALMKTPPTNWELDGDPADWPQKWASEILPLANAALTRVDYGTATETHDGQRIKCTWPVTLQVGYAKWADVEGLKQLTKAGYRLAALIRAVLTK